MILNQAVKNKKYKIVKINATDEVGDRFAKLGFIAGEMIELKRKAPIFGSPLLYQVGESQIALTKEEANYIEVDEVEENYV